MIILYFSGTGNSKYLAQLFCKYTDAGCFSIEDQIDFGKLLDCEETIGFCYPIYGSRIPRVMREFVQRHIEKFKNKKIIIFCTQLIFSGDGARVFTDMFPENYYKVIYAEHFLMPNNVCNLFFLPLANEKSMKKYAAKAEKKVRIVCGNIKNGVIKKRGFNIFSVILGSFQGVFMPLIEKKSMDTVVISGNCSRCLHCVNNCPMKNLEFANGSVIQKSNCTMCYRCINNCPKKAIKMFFKAEVKKQYRGLSAVL